MIKKAYFLMWNVWFLGIKNNSKFFFIGVQYLVSHPKERMSFGVFPNSIDNSVAGRKTKCQPNVGNFICNEEFHNLLSNNIKVITFDMD
jgi:hypothetical protein